MNSLRPMFSWDDIGVFLALGRQFQAERGLLFLGERQHLGAVHRMGLPGVRMVEIR